MRNINQKITLAIATTACVALGFSSCTKLDEKLFGSKSEVTSSTGSSSADLKGVYNQLNQMVTQGNWFALEEHTTDELLGPTRGTDWDDFGTWRKLHLHTWDGAHNQLYDTWNGLNGAVFQATLVVDKSTGKSKAEAQFLRAYFMYLVCDIYGQVPFRATTDGPDAIPKVYSRAEAIDFILTDLDAAIAALPDYSASSDKHFATKQSAQFLKMKALLNKAVYKQDPKNPAGPFTFNAGDMNAVIALADAIKASGKFSLTPYYWDNFKWDNSTKSNEIIFSRSNADGAQVVFYTYMGFHYNQTPGGWNGFTTIADFYDSFEDADVRKGAAIPGYTDKVGNRAGFLVGLQQGPQGQKVGNPLINLKDRSGSPLNFTRDVSLFYSSETKGIRTVKYPLDPATINDGGWSSANDFIYFRYSDVLLMKAEAILRGGSPTGGETPASIVNGIRANRGASNLATVDLKALLAERGRELYLEGWRRNDLVRFEKFNDPVDQRPVKSDAYRVVFSIPVQAVSTNPNLKQNFGY